MTTNWNLFVNFFLNATKGNFTKALKMSKFHFDALTAKSPGNVFVQGLLTYFTPFHQAMQNADNARKAQSGGQHGTVVTFESLLSQMTTNVNSWDANIQTHYAKGSGTYSALFPRGHYPFSEGSQADQVQAVKVLIDTIGSDAALASVKATIQTYYTALKNAFDAKDQSKQNTDTMNAAEIVAWQNMCTAMLSNYGKIIDHYSSSPQDGAQFFDRETIQNIQQTDYTGHTEPLHSDKICRRTVDANQLIRLQNKGTVPQRFFLAASAKDSIGATYVEVAPNGDITVHASQLGNTATMHNFMVYNVDATSIAEWQFTFE